MIDIHQHGPFAHLRLARPPVNALNPELCLALVAAVDEAAAAGSHGILLSGGARVFSAGLDVPYLMSLGDDRAALRTAWEAFFAAARALANSPIPVAVAMEGHAPAGGCVLALCCDYRVMADAPIQIGLNETHVGLAVPQSVQILLHRTIGHRRAERMLLVGAMVEAREAQAIGLVDALATPGNAEAEALGWLESLEGLPRAPMLATRALSRADMIEALSTDRLDIDQPLRDWQHPDTQHALRALLARLGKG
ncbi:enoyl-CoA hydratase/isomerase family protein [Solilutibacter tolerans]|uniref:Enoyl-CoA hydratase/carnithine racemase n=1 Tax=Solilutibacter tolerans TaxID=1604334 RepID=A0A1N6P884_9GAMM|nr:enoyl-CoA hydratase/isomerase family protein [Lysobacter tolerans]SIQ00581.1 Enoyl-CoA hydratase/carnithine racemase [Lysobacter tolerans]